MSKMNGSASTKRIKGRHRGITYRKKADGSTTYSVYWQGKFLKAGKTEKEALAMQADLRSKAARGERVILPSKLNVAEVGKEHLADAESRLRPGWARDYRRAFERIIVPAWGNRAISSITPHDVIALDQELRRSGRSEATVANYLKPARGMFDYALLQGYIPVNPFTQIPRRRLSSCNRTRQHREWTSEEVHRVIEEGHKLDALKGARAKLYGLAIEMKLRTGARLGELLGARYGDIDVKNHVWKITFQWTREGALAEPKTEKAKRRIPITPELAAKIAARKLATGAGDNDFIFASKKGGRPLSHTNYRKRAWHPAVEAAGLTDGPKVTPHDARHAFASEMDALGLSSSDVAEVMGHTTAGITERIYTHSFNRDQREERIRKAMETAMASGQ
jgi:integrase